jgi:hypothetical protein
MISSKMETTPIAESGRASRRRTLGNLGPAQILLLLSAALAYTGAACAADPTAINGVYTGEFKRSSDTAKLTLSIKAEPDGSLTGLFTFAPPAQRGSSITYKLTGKYVANARHYGLASSPFEFTTLEPVGSGAQEALTAFKAQAVHIGINGPGSIVGSLTGSDPASGEFNCGWISARRDNAQSADLAKVMAAQASAVSTTAPAAPVVRREFEGVYNGSYVGRDGLTTKLKLTLWLQREVRTAGGQLVHTELAGLLTAFASEGSGTMPYTSEIKGFYIDGNRTVQALAVRWEPPPSGVFLARQLMGKFDPNGGASGTPQIAGYLDLPTNPKVLLVRDATESAAMDLERLRNHVRPGLVGVFNGTYSREGGPPAKFKLTITHNQDGAQGLAGRATIYLPVGGSTKAYSYDLKGVEALHGEFQLRVQDWVTAPPPDFRNFRAMGFNGKLVLNEALTAARLASVAPPPSAASDFLPEFEATYDPAESADITGTLEAQEAVGKAEQAAAMKARDEMIRNARPKQWASTDLVRKSRPYWDRFQYDMIREVFDGGFGAAIDENREFQMLFCAYVETFSAKCPDCLPANHQTITVTLKTNRKFDDYGRLISEDTQTLTIEMDARFVDKYREFSSNQNTRADGMRLALAAQRPGGAQGVLNGLLAVASDLQRFFADHGGRSAAMRQMNENFLRAIAGQPSLQQSDGKIDGAPAESDRDLPPGRYARFVDAANAYFRERAERDPVKFGSSASHDTAFCQRLAELYRSDMSLEEEYYYANDFEARFLPIMGPRASCPDPAWPKLHPDVEKAVADVN